MDQHLPKRERLRGKARLDTLFKEGLVGKSHLILVRALPNGLAYSRTAAIVGKQAGSAVMRNRIRRRLRAAYRSQKQSLPSGFDLVLLARRGVHEARFRDLMAAMCRAVRSAAHA